MAIKWFRRGARIRELTAELEYVTARLAEVQATDKLLRERLSNAEAKLDAVLAEVGPVTVTRGRMAPDGPARVAPALALLTAAAIPAPRKRRCAFEPGCDGTPLPADLACDRHPACAECGGRIMHEIACRTARAERLAARVPAQATGAAS